MVVVLVVKMLVLVVQLCRSDRSHRISMRVGERESAEKRAVSSGRQQALLKSKLPRWQPRDTVANGLQAKITSNF